MWSECFGPDDLECPLLISLGLAGNLYYLVLVPMGLATAGFLFGVLHSYAWYRRKQFGGMLDWAALLLCFPMGNRFGKEPRINSIALPKNLRSTGTHAAVIASMLKDLAIFVLLIAGNVPVEAATLKGVILANEFDGVHLWRILGWMP